MARTEILWLSKRLATVVTAACCLTFSCDSPPPSPPRPLVVSVDPAMSGAGALTSSTKTAECPAGIGPLKITADSPGEGLLHLVVVVDTSNLMCIDEMWIDLGSPTSGQSRGEIKGIQDGVKVGCTNVGGSIVVNSATLPSATSQAPLVVRYDLVGDCFGSDGGVSRTIQLAASDIRKGS